MDRLKILTAIKKSNYWGCSGYVDNVLDNKKTVSVFMK